MKLLLINDTTAHENWGAQATPEALRGMLARELPDAEVTFLPNEWLHRTYLTLGNVTYRRGAIPHLQWVLDRLSHPTRFFPVVADEFDAVADEWKRGAGGPPAREFLRLASGVDAVVYNAENSIYRNTHEGCRGIFLAWFAKTRLGKVSAVINQTAHITGVKPIMRGMIQLAYPLLDLVTAREPRSLRCLHDLGIDKAMLVPDPVFSLDWGRAPRPSFERWLKDSRLEGSDYFCLSASALPVARPRGGWDGPIVALVERLQGLSCRAVLVAKDPHCQFLREVARRTGAHFYGPEHEHRDLWPLFRGARFLVTGHYHYAIIASVVGCPFVPFTTNNHKMAGLCEMLGAAVSEPHDITYLGRSADLIVEAATHLTQHRDVHGAALARRSAELADQAIQSAGLIRELVAAKGGQVDAGAGSRFGNARRPEVRCP